MTRRGAWRSVIEGLEWARVARAKTREKRMLKCKKEPQICSVERARVSETELEVNVTEDKTEDTDPERSKEWNLATQCECW